MPAETKGVRVFLTTANADGTAHAVTYPEATAWYVTTNLGLDILAGQDVVASFATNQWRFVEDLDARAE